MLTLTSNDLPEELLRLPQPPKQLHILGANLSELMKRPRIAVVGSRKISSEGTSIVKKLTETLVEGRFVIVSGLALGTDTIAHKTCLQAGGQTIAVLPSELGKVYPHSNHKLAFEIIDGKGCLISEYEEGSQTRPHNFLARNRLIAALSDALLVVEAGERSGSLNVARHALRLGKPVFTTSSRNNKAFDALINEGAVNITDAKEITEMLL